MSEKNITVINNGTDLSAKERADAAKDKNHNFVQVNKQYWRAIGELSKRNPTAFQLLWFLAEKVNKQNAVIIGMDTLSKFVGKTRQSCSTAIKLLKEEKWVQVVKVGQANAYVINAAVFWQSTAQGKMAVFHAAVIADRDEQGVEFDEGVKLKSFPILQDNERLIISGKTPPPDQQEIDLI